jgi:hypothetical protein
VIESGAPSPRSWPARPSWNGEASPGVNRRAPNCSLPNLTLDEGRAVKTATNRAAEAIEAAEVMFADEMGATLDLSPAAKVALMATIAAAIEGAIAEEHERLTCVQ